MHFQERVLDVSPGFIVSDRSFVNVCARGWKVD